MSHSWKTVWREGVAPFLPTAGLQSLRQALLTDDARLVQGATTVPPPLVSAQDYLCEGACLISYPFAFSGDEPLTVGVTEERFAEVCFQCDQRLREPAACRYLLNWFDDSPRGEVRRLLLPEVERELAERQEPVIETYWGPVPLEAS